MKISEIFVNSAWGDREFPLPSAGIEPHPATFYVTWGIIFVYQIIWNIYGLYTLGKIGPDGTGYLYSAPPYTPPAVYVFFILANGFGIGWSFAYDRLRPDIGLPLLALMPFNLYLSIIFSVRGLSRHGLQLYQSGYDVHIRLARGLIQNGMGVYATWTTIATLLNLGTVLRLYADVDEELAGIILLGILSGELVIFLILDWCVLEKYMRYIFTPYFVLVGALTGVLGNNFEPWTDRTIFTTVLLGVAALAMLVKFILAGSRVQARTDYILKAAGIKSHKQAAAMMQYPPGVSPYDHNVPPPPSMVPNGMAFTPDPRAMDMMEAPMPVSVSNVPMVMQPSGISGSIMAPQGQPSFSMVPAPPELGAKTGTQNVYGAQEVAGTAVAYNNYT